MVLAEAAVLAGSSAIAKEGSLKEKGEEYD